MVSQLLISQRVRRCANLLWSDLDRGFCPDCGSPVVIQGQRLSLLSLISLWAASLDDPSWFRPAMDIFVVSAQPWDFMNPALRKFERTPTEEQARELLTPRG